MKKIITVLLITALTLSTLMLASCGGKSDDTTTAAPSGTASGEEGKTSEPDGTDAPGTQATVEPVEVPDVTLKYVAADIYVNEEAVESSGYKKADALNLSNWFAEKKEFDADFNPIIPAGFSMTDGYVLRISQGQYIMEVDVLKVADAANIETVKAMAEYRCQKQRNNGDFKLYDDEEGTNAKMIETGKVAVFGNFVVYAVTWNTEVSMLRAQNYVANHPDCTAVELYRAIVSEEN